MKKILFSIATALVASVAAFAQTNVETLRIYINPGHGSWTANDRPCTLVGHGEYTRFNTDTLSFFESNTNLYKGYGMLDKLREYGLKYDNTLNIGSELKRWEIGASRDLSNNIVMSHCKAGPYHDDNGTATQLTNDGKEVPADLAYYNRSLSEIAAEVQYNNFDCFVSIHSNAATEGTNTNFPLFLYRGWDNCTVPSDVTDFGTDNQAESKAMAQACWKYIYGNEHQPWTAYSLTNMNLRGDISFYGSSGLNSNTGARAYLSVLRHNVPGFLSEGYFHTYQPSRHRAMNPDVSRLEGIAYARGLADYFGLQKEQTGEIYGIVRDLHEKFSDAAYTANATSDDKYLPLNGAKVTLKNAEGVVGEYTTDNYYNGAFVFSGLAAGTYTVEVQMDGYKPAEAVTVTVKPAETSYTRISLESESYVPPTIVYENYPDPVEGAEGFHLFSQYNMGTATESQLVAADVLAGKTIRRQIQKNGVTYILALDETNEPYVYAVKDGTVTEIDKTAIALPANGQLKLSDIALTAEGVLVGVSLSKNHYSESIASGDGVSRGTMNAYKWEKNEDTGLPGASSLWFTSIFSGNFNRAMVGNTLAYSGTLAEGNFVTTCANATAQTMRVANFGIADGAMVSTSRANCSTAFNRDVTTTNDAYELNVSPRDKTHFTYDGTLISPMEWKFNKDAAAETILGTNKLAPAAAMGANYFRFAGRSLMVTPNVVDGSVCGLKLFDVTDGFGEAKEIDVKCEIDPVVAKYASAHGSHNVTLDATDVPTAAKLVLSLIVDGKMYQWTEASAPVYTPATGTANAFAYGLEGVVKDNCFVATYKLNAPVDKTTITIFDPEGNVLKTHETGAQDAGLHSEDIDITDIIAEGKEGNNTWQVAVEYAAKSAPEYINGYRFYHPRGVDIDNNMESDHFGNIYCTEGIATSSATYISGTGGTGIGGGLYAFDASLSPIKNPATDKYGFMGGLTYSYVQYGADLARVRVADDGRIFVSRCNTAGDYICYAKDFTDLYSTDRFTSLTSGLTFNSSNVYVDADDNFVTGPNVGLDIQGSGDELQLTALSKLTLSATYNARVDVIALGNETALTAGENIAGLTNKYTIMPQSTSIARDNRGGIWYCQYRATPTAEQPALVYIDSEGVERYKDLVVRGGGGLRFSPDYKYLAVSSSKTQFTIYAVEYDAENNPFLQPQMTITHGIGTNLNDIAWDLAGNIYICGNSSEWLKGFALPGHSSFVTKAPASQSFATGISAVSADDVDAPVEYFNLQGIRVNGDNLTPGIYIRRQGKTTEKIIVK